MEFLRDRNRRKSSGSRGPEVVATCRPRVERRGKATRNVGAVRGIGEDSSALSRLKYLVRADTPRA